MKNILIYSLAIAAFVGLLAFAAHAQDADGSSPDTVTPDGGTGTVTVSDYGG